ncbi:asparagine synthase (glutamine-hydrolyzing) [Candidatus Woesearchaeota archaeon]|nr:asparagine synthase (glutamine-hydrolyzing) [Candidatus Woesearchaeota archaeon]
MCGIIGFNWEDQKLIRKCTNILKHRGPDAAGYYTSKGVSFGQRRLAIIDTSVKGNQPMCNEEGNLWINYNGETYNYNELKAALKKKHKFISRTDTEVILHLYEELQEKCLDLLNGMFAIAIWDDDKKELFIARDRYGIKPLYYYWDKTKFIFASEIKAILETGINREIDLEALNNYFTYKFSLGPKTLFKNIYKLQPGHFLKLKNNKLIIKQWYDLNYNPLKKSKDYFVKKIQHELDLSVKRRLISDVPIGAFLSGGIDSSAVVATMSKFSQEPVQTFSVGFEEASYNELPFARKISERYETDHHEIIMDFNHIRELLPKITWHLDEPFGDFACIPTHMVSEFARKKVTVALSGDGGDESFIGYRQALFQHHGRFYSKLPGVIKNSILNLSKNFLNKTGNELRALKNYSINNDALRSLSWNMFIDNDLKKKIYSYKLKDYIGSEKNILDRYNPKIKNYAELNKNLYTEIKTWLPDDALFKVDKMSMMNSLEARVPFLDHNITELAAGIPVKHKVNGFETKHILKLAMKDRLPKEIIYRKKHGFNLPTGEWFRKELREFTEEIIFDRELKPLLNLKSVSKLFNEHLNKREDYRYQLNTLLSFGLWYKIYIKKENYKKFN